MIEYNIIHNYGYSTSDEGTSGHNSGVRLWRVDDVKIYNNIFSNGGSNWKTRGIFARYWANNLKIKNNIFYNNQNPDLYILPDTTASGFESDYNIIYQ